MNRWLVIMAVLGLFIMPIIILTAGWAVSRGLEVTEMACQWEPEADQFMTTAGVKNLDEAFKVVAFRVQGRFHPLPGHRWAHPAVRQHYEAVSQTALVVMEPKAETAINAAFTLPDGQHYACRAQALVSRQLRFPERPSPETLRVVLRQLQNQQ